MSRHARPRRLRLVVLAVVALTAAGAAGFWLASGGLLGATSGTAAAGPTATDPPYDGSLDGPAVPVTAPEDDGTSPATSSSAGSTGGGSAAKREVQVAQTYSGWDDAASGVVAGGIVTGVVEDGGTCTLTLTRNGAEFSGTGEGLASATTTSCGQMAVAGSELSSGSWTAVIGYASPGAAGRSEAFEVVVP